MQHDSNGNVLLIPDPIKFAEFASGFDTPCWLWLGELDKAGYAMFSMNFHYPRVHRVYYQELRGPLAPSAVLDHRCRWRSCVNPWHLEATTEAVNTQRGLAAKLNPEKVRAIRADVDMVHVVQAEAYAVSPSTIDAVHARKTWKNI